MRFQCPAQLADRSGVSEKSEGIISTYRITLIQKVNADSRE